MIVGRACIYIKDDRVACAEGPRRKLAVVDPFEQRGNKTILVTQEPHDQVKTPEPRSVVRKEELAKEMCKPEPKLLTPAQ